MAERSVVSIAANDFTRQWQDIRDDALEAVDRVGRSGWLVLGEEVRGFETEFSRWWGVPHAVGVASGLDALEISLRCANISAGSRVLTTPLTAFATTLSILRVGAEPIWCDVDETGGLDLDQADAALHADPSIRALMPVHLYGHPLDSVALRDLAEKHGIVVIEDCAQSVGATRGGGPTGTVGLLGATSLYPTKNLGAMGDGGLVLTADKALAEKARALRDYGQRGRYQHVERGLNSRLDELHAAILRTAMLPRLQGWLDRRRQIADFYVSALDNTLLRPIKPAEGQSAHHLFPVEVMNGSPEAVAVELEREGISAGRHYPFLCPDQPAVKGGGITLGPLALARRLAQRELSLPIHPYLTDVEVESVAEACLKVAA